VSRQWWDLHNRIRAGVVHDRPDSPLDGGLALFCPACPQIDINIPPETDWKVDDKWADNLMLHNSIALTYYRLLYRPQLVSDGNMKLVHLKMRRPEDDVSLSDGQLFMVKRAPYAEHLATAPERQPVSCHMVSITSMANRCKEIKMQ